jgi:hypothetical protein
MKRREMCKRPLNILLGATPGSGKSFLVKELSRQLNSENINSTFLEFQISAFRGFEDLNDAFHIVQSENLSGKTPLVLFDEIDTPVNGKCIYPYFLGPMWSSEFFEGVKKHNIGKAIFFFAGSSIFSADNNQNRFLPLKSETIAYSEYRRNWFSTIKLDDEKIIDFLDRIDHTIFIPPLTREIENSNPEVEYCMLALSLINKYHNTDNQLKRIELKATWVIIDFLTRYNSRRRAESIVFLSKTPSNDEFKYINLPNDVQTVFSNINQPNDPESKYFLND